MSNRTSNLGPFHTRFQIPSHLWSILAILAVESTNVGTYYFTRGPKSQVPSHFLEVRLETCVVSNDRGELVVSYK